MTRPKPEALVATPRQRAWYGFGQIAEGLKNDSFAIFLLFYYREVLGLSGTLAGLSMLISLGVDAVTDPLMGRLSDRTRSGWGRRHPYMLASVAPVAAAYYLVFVPPDGLSQYGLFAWLTTFAVLARVAMTLFMVPYLALGAELADDYDERTRIVTIRMTFATFGRVLPGFFGLMVFMRPTEAFPNGQLNPAAYPPYALVTAALIGIPIVLSALGTWGVIKPLKRRLADRPVDRLVGGIAADLVACLKIRNFRVHFAGSTVAFTAWGIIGTLGLHLSTYFWRVSTQVLFLWGIGMFSGLFVGLAFWSRVAEVREKRDVFVLGLGVFLLFTSPPILLRALGVWPPDDSPAHIALYVGLTGFCAHFGIASPLLAGGSMMADVTDEDELLHGARREGIFFGAVNFAAKAFTGIGAQLAGLMVDLAGLVPGSEPENVAPEVSQRLGMMVGCSLALLVGVSMWIYMRYDLTRARHSEVRTQLTRVKPAE